jgi:hypothetical protein
MSATVDGQWLSSAKHDDRDVAFNRAHYLSKKSLFHRVNLKGTVCKLQGRLFSEMAQNSKCRPAELQAQRFLHKFKLNFVCLVLDIRMQVVKMLDPSVQAYNSVPGLNIFPDFLNPNIHIDRDDPDCIRSNLLEITMSQLPRDTFAVVPVLLDDLYAAYSDEYDEAVFRKKDEQRVKQFTVAGQACPWVSDSLCIVYCLNSWF